VYVSSPKLTYEHILLKFTIGCLHKTLLRKYHFDSYRQFLTPVVYEAEIELLSIVSKQLIIGLHEDGRII
jgi:hypothetical protein